MKRLIMLQIGLLLLMATSATLAADDLNLLRGTLDQEQVTRTFSGRTAVAVQPDGDELVYYFDPDGELRQVRNGWQKRGAWSVRKDGRLCLDLGDDRDCRAIARKGSEFLQYRVRKDGDHRPEQTYVAFRDGEQLARLSKDPILPAGTLKRREVVELFSGQTVESVTADKGRVSLTYYSPDGKVEQLRDGKKRHGTWRVNSGARMCLQMEGLQEKCRILVAEDGEIRKYIVKKSGRHQHSVSYRHFRSGKTFR